MLHGGKTFRTPDPRTFATVCTQAGHRQVVVILHGHLLTPETDRHGQPIWPRHTPRILKKQAERAFHYKMVLDRRAAAC